MDFVVPNWPGIIPEVLASVLAALQDGEWGRYNGRSTVELAEKLSRRFEQPFVTLCSSGTVAVELALRGLAVESGQEVILGGYDFPGNFRAIEVIGATPVLVDLSPNRFALDAEGIESAISERTAAVIVSHLHGNLAPMKQVMELARSRGISVVEDACQCPGATIHGVPAGSFGDVSVLSFGGSKLLTAGRGGAVLSRDGRVHQRIKVFQDRGNLAFPLSELQAAALLPQLDLLDALHNRRLGAARVLKDHLRGRMELPDENSDARDSAAFYKFPLFLPNSKRDAFCASAQRLGIPLFPGFHGFVNRSSRRCRQVGSLPNSRRFAEQTMLLHHPALLMSESQITQLAEALVSMLEP